MTSEDQLRQVGVVIHHGYLFPSTLFNLVRATSYVVKLVRRYNIDILHSHHRFTTVVGHLVSRLTGKPLVVTVHEYKQNFKPLARLWTGTVTITPSKALKQHLIDYYDVPESRILVVPHALTPITQSELGKDTTRTLMGIDPRQQYICYIGRLSVEKGVRYLVESIPLVNAHIGMVQCLVVGDGPQRYELEQQVRDLGLAAQIRFLGARTDIAHILEAVDVVVIPSLAESFALVALEAMQAGQPVVATDVGGIPEVVRNGHTGILVPPSSPKAIANAVSWLLSDREARHTLGYNGRQVAETEYSPANVADQMLTAYRMAITKGISI